MTVSQLNRAMDSAELSEWMAYDKLKDEKYEGRLRAKTRTASETAALVKQLTTRQ